MPPSAANLINTFSAILSPPISDRVSILNRAEAEIKSCRLSKVSSSNFCACAAATSSGVTFILTSSYACLRERTISGTVNSIVPSGSMSFLPSWMMRKAWRWSSSKPIAFWAVAQLVIASFSLVLLIAFCHSGSFSRSSMLLTFFLSSLWTIASTNSRCSKS